jgi:hypothetical protein
MNAEAYARMLEALLPPSKVWLRVGVVQDALLASGDELERVDIRARELLEESDPRTADELLPDFERVLGLASTGTLAARRALVVARLLHRGRFRPQDFRDVLAPILGLDPSDVVVIERTAAEALAMGDQREIFRFFIWRNPALAGSYDLDAAQEMVDRMKPSHTLGHVILSTDFLCDDPESLCDRDVLGV